RGRSRVGFQLVLLISLRFSLVVSSLFFLSNEGLMWRGTKRMAVLYTAGAVCCGGVKRCGFLHTNKGGGLKVVRAVHPRVSSAFSSRPRSARQGQGSPTGGSRPRQTAF